MVSVKGSKITLNGQSVTVVNQHKIKGTYAKELSAHGAGHSGAGGGAVPADQYCGAA